MINVGIVGVTGYVGIELLRLLQQHPAVNVALGVSDASAGEDIASLYPHFNGQPSFTTEQLNIDSIIQHCDLVFIALPHGHALELVQPLLSAGKKVIDLGADFRLKNPVVYEQYYQKKSAAPTLLEQAVYGLPEKGNKNEIQHAALIANPGCYPTASILSVLPAIKAGIVDIDSCIFDAKSGISGAGKNSTARTHYCELANTVIPYQISGLHRHTPEIEQELSLLAGKTMTVQFTPHLIPIIRGLLVTAYLTLNKPISEEEVFNLYKETYQDQPFIRIVGNHHLPHIKFVCGTNYCDLGVSVDTRTQRLIVISVIDNLIKGAAGQAIQNMNLMYQLPETMGLANTLATYP